MTTVQSDADQEKSNHLFSFLIAGLIAFSESNWKYPYPSTLSRARGLLFGASIERGKWKFESMGDFIKLVQTPIRSWWPYDTFPEGIDPDACLVNADFQIPSYVEELLLDLDDLSENQRFNAAELKLVLDNRKIREALQQAKDHPELEDAYVVLRRFLIEHPWINVGDGVDVPREARQLMVQINDYYEMPSINMRHEGKYWLCPRCNGILIWGNDKPRCATDGLCDHLVEFEQANSIIGDIRTLKMTFRKRVQLPGLPEIQLFKELSEISDIDVKLWPDADRYDLSVEKKGKFHWAIDVKDYASEFSLSSLFRKKSPPYIKGMEFFYAVPDHREQISRGYLHRLRKLSPNAIRIRLVSDLLREAKRL
jgi:hypothetical protein